MLTKGIPLNCDVAVGWCGGCGCIESTNRKLELPMEVSGGVLKCY
jgi:hypothetical protein